ncbi:MAG: YDG domain-containing protein [Pirellulaceae bacterium]|nr:YDG domain-containing protein [Pirellulaceae bacterium]
MKLLDRVSGLLTHFQSHKIAAKNRKHVQRRSLLVEDLEGRRLLATINLGSLLAAQGTIIYGADIGDASGVSVSNAGDFNGDGYDDVLIGAVQADASGDLKPNAGDSYIVFGGPSLSATINLSGLDSAGVTIWGADSNDFSGSTVSGAGDLNGDGFDDIVIGASFGDGDGNARSYSGEAYVIFGSAAPAATINLASLGASGATIYGAEAFDQAGFSVSGAGDVNGDGFNDVIIGAIQANAAGNAKTTAGDSYIVFGTGAWPATIDLSTLGSTGVTIYGAESGDQSGYSVSGIGDINGDGLDDLAIGAIGGDAVGNAKLSAGDTFVIFGSLSLPTTIDLTTIGTLSGLDGIMIFGANANDNSGVSVSNAGDLNGDGFNDMLIGAPDADASGNSLLNAGDSYIVFGGPSLPATIDLSSLGLLGITLFGATAGDQNGFSVSGAGDVNGDGYDDLIVSALDADALGDAKLSAGESYVIFGGPSLPSTIDLASPPSSAITIFGAEAGDKSGTSVSRAGDVNGDGFDDLIIGAFGAAAAANAKAGAGESYIIFGGNGFTSSATHLGATGDDSLTGTAGADIMVGGRGNDILVGSGGADVLIGGQGNDILAISSTNFRRIVGGTGNDTLRLVGSGITLDLETLAYNRIFGIETIDITGSGNNTLMLGRRDVLRISDETNTLTVEGNAGDRLSTIGWTFISNASGFNTYTRGNATLIVRDTITVQYTLDLANLNAARGTTVFGAEQGIGGFPGDRSGYSVSNAGDVNGDGFDDMIIGAYEADASGNGLDAAGDSYLIFGSASLPSSLDLASLGSAGVVIYGATAGDFSGWSVSTAGDMNGDGFDDVFIGAKYASGFVGKSYVLFGHSTFGSSINLASPTGVTVSTLSGVASNDFTGYSVSSAGDLDGDGYYDLAIGAPGANSTTGKVYLVYGSAIPSSTFNLGSLGSGGTTISGAAVGDNASGSVSNAGDVNGDGLDDLIIGAYQANSNTGKSYIVFGSTTRVASFNLATLGAAGVTINGIASPDNSGRSVSGGGDVNGDGFDDVVIGATLGDAYNNLKANAGESYVIFGSAFLPAVINLTSLGSAGMTIFGANAGDYSGSSVSIAGDVNGDGYDDFIIGAIKPDGSAGASYLLFGGAVLPTMIDLATLGTPGIANGMTVFGVDANDQSGVSVSNAGDVNGDGFDDLLIGANYANSVGNARTKAGETYIIFGRDYLDTVTQKGSAASELIAGTPAANNIVGGRGSDTIAGNGGADVINGGQGGDVISVSSLDFRRIYGGTGNDTLQLDGTGLTLDLSTVANRRIQGIETIDISGTGDNTLVFNQREVLNLSDSSNTLIVRRDAGDVINRGSGWTQVANQTIGSDIFNVYTQGAATLLVMNVTPIVTVTSGGKIYDKQVYVATASVTNNNSPAPTLSFQFYSDAGGTTIVPTPTNAGSYFVRAFTAASEGNNAAQSSIVPFTIQKAFISVVASANTKVYNASTTATLSFVFSGVYAGDTVTSTTNGTFNNKNVGTGKAVTVPTITISGASAINYILTTQNTSTTGIITARALTPTTTGVNRVYDGTTNANVTIALSPIQGSDVITGSATGTFANKNIGNAKSITVGTITLAGIDAGNYTVGTAANTTANITAKALTASGTAANKIYDGNINAVITISLGGIVGGETVTGLAAGTFDTKNVGVGKAVTIGAVALGGVDAGNYTVGAAANTTANITAKALVGTIIADNKAFDGTTTAKILRRTITGVVAGDVVSYINGTATFDTSALGTGKPVNATGLSLSGTDAANYAVNTAAATTANIVLYKASIYYKGSGFESIGGVEGALDNYIGKTLMQSGPSAQLTTLANVSNYSLGINGIVLDIGKVVSGTLAASDFIFRSPTTVVSDPVNPSAWNAVVPTPAISVTPGTSSRIRLDWAIDAIKNTWLQVIVKANAATGLAAPIVFYIGHAAGDVNGVVGASTPYRTGTPDLSAVQSGVSSALVSIEDARDIDKNRRVGTTDLSYVQARVNSTALLRNITIPIAGSANEGAPSAPPTSAPGISFGGSDGSSSLVPTITTAPTVPLSVKITTVSAPSASTTPSTAPGLFAQALTSGELTSSKTTAIDQVFVTLGRRARSVFG